MNSSELTGAIRCRLRAPVLKCEQGCKINGALLTKDPSLN